MNAAEAIANGLAGAGCKHVFGMPGGEVLVLLDALRVAGLEFTLVKHENAGGYMAEGSWHATGAPGVLIATLGPGLANAINTVANAYQEQVPLIVLSGCVTDEMAAQFTHQVMDQSAMMAPVTKATLRIETGTAAQVVRDALSIAMTDPMGPVHIDLPDALALDEVAGAVEAAVKSAPNYWPEGEDRQQAIEMLSNSKKPIILAGLGAVHHAAGPVILALAEKHQIPVVTTHKAKGIIPEDHPLALGGHGLSPLSDKSILPLLAASDCVILAGYDPIEMRAGWIRPWAAENAIEIMHAANDHGMHGCAVQFIGDVGAAVTALGGPDGPVWPDGEPAAARVELQRVFSSREVWGPHQIYATLNECLPKDAVVTVDSGAHRILLSQMWQCNRPNSLLQSSAFCSMGVAVPLAIGYKRGAPDTPVVAVVGDAGFDMTTGDLATLRDMHVPVVIVVPVDNSLALIEKKQTMMQLKNHGVQFVGTDIVAVARAYGGVGVVVESREGLEAAVEEALARDTFTVLACPIDKSDYDGAF